MTYEKANEKIKAIADEQPIPQAINLYIELGKHIEDRLKAKEQEIDFLKQVLKGEEKQ